MSLKSIGFVSEAYILQTRNRENGKNFRILSF